MTRVVYRPDTYRLRESIGYLLKHAFRMLTEEVEAEFAQRDYTFQQWLVLMHLRDGLAGTIAELSRSLRHDSGAMTRLVDQLDGRGLIRRRRNRTDRRIVELDLTSAGHEAVEALIPVALGTLNEALDGLTRDEVRILKSSLARMIGNLEARRAASAENVP